MDLHTRIQSLINTHPHSETNLSRAELIREAIDRRECLVTQSGALAIWNPKNATGRIPKDTYTVQHPDELLPIEWKVANNVPMTPEMFESLLEDALAILQTKDCLFIQDRSVSADPAYALPVRTIAPRAITALFAENMFRPAIAENSQSIFGEQGFTIIVVPTDAVDTAKYEGKLRIDNGKPVNALIAMDFKRKIGLVYGTLYCGAVKKLVFTVMNALLPVHDVLSLHCSASQDSAGDTHLFLGLSGTGKTTLSADPKRRLIGDDEHLWSKNGVANLEWGSYAKLIKLRQEKEPMIYDAVFGKRPIAEHGCIVENAMVYPDGSIDVDDERLTENSRASFPLSYVGNVVEDAKGNHPKTVIFLTADARGVLPPVAKLTPDQALLWFLMGYTSKLAGTETGITSPVTTFSRFFGGPFMPLTSESYLSLLRKKLTEHQTNVYLINTGWTGGAYGTGKRMDIDVTRAIVDSALAGQLEQVSYRTDPRFHLDVPTECPGIEAALLDPKRTWTDMTAYDTAATQLASEFAAHFDKNFMTAVSAEIAAQCPGK